MLSLSTKYSVMARLMRMRYSETVADTTITVRNRIKAFECERRKLKRRMSSVMRLRE